MHNGIIFPLLKNKYMSALLRQFQEQGYLVISQLNTDAECDALMKRAEELAAGYDYSGHPSVFQTTDQARSTDDYFLQSGDKIAYFFERDAFDERGELKSDLFHSLNKIGHALHDLDPVFDRFSRSPQMKELAAALGLQEHVLIQSMMIFKHARIGGVVDVHQDATFLYTEPESCVGFWFALEDATIENGCLWAKAGGHRTPLRGWFRRKEGGGTEMLSLDAAPWEMEGMEPLEVKKGTCIVLHGLLPHYSMPNTSGRSRQAYAIHTIDPRAEYPGANWLWRDPQSLRGWS
jgi:phytanoyl-CoA hydroxylase